MSNFLLNKWLFSLAELENFKKENAEIRFESLRSQLNPHFLFNSLNTLSSLIYENQKNAELFIRELSDVYRYILENSDKELVPLSKELDFAQSYIHLIQLRFDKNLIVITDLKIDNKKYHTFYTPQVPRLQRRVGFSMIILNDNYLRRGHDVFIE